MVEIIFETRDAWLLVSILQLLFDLSFDAVSAQMKFHLPLSLLACAND